MLNAKPTWRGTLKALFYLAPLLLITTCFTVWPLIHAFTMSLYTKYDFYSGQVTALGGANFTALWHDPNFHLALRNTLIFILGVVPATVLLSLGIALLLNHIPHLTHLFQTLYFLPFVTSTVAISLVWNWLFHRNNGLINLMLHHNIDWLNDPHYALSALIVVCIWQNLGFNIILFLAGLNHLDARTQQAARLDGASTWQRLTNVTWPLLLPMTVLITVNAIIANFKVFDQIYALFHGTAGPANADLTLMYYLYQKFYVEAQYPLAAACGVVLFGLILLVSGLCAWYLRRHAWWGGGRLQ